MFSVINTEHLCRFIKVALGIIIQYGMFPQG